MHLTIKEQVELVLMSGADGVCYYYLNCFICFGALFMAHPVYLAWKNLPTGTVSNDGLVFVFNHTGATFHSSRAKMSNKNYVGSFNLYSKCLD